MSLIKIVYGTGSGNTEMVCEKVAEVLGAAGHQVELLKAKLTTPADIGERDLLILASPTYGHGLLETYMANFCYQFEKEADMKDKPCAIIGLGDPKYDSDYHIEAVKILSDMLKRMEAEIVYIPLRVSKCPLPLLDNHVVHWAEKLGEHAEKL